MKFKKSLVTPLLGAVVIIASINPVFAGTRIGEYANCAASLQDLWNALCGFLGGLGFWYKVARLYWALTCGSFTILGAILLVIGCCCIAWLIYQLIRAWLSARGCRA